MVGGGPGQNAFGGGRVGLARQLEPRQKSFKEYARPKTVRVELLGRGEPVSKELVIEDRVHRLDIPIEGDARKIRIHIQDRYEGLVYSDLFVAEVGINFHKSREAIARMVEWVRSSAADRSHERHENEVRDAFGSIRDAEFGDPEKLAWLMDQAGDGPGYIRRKALQLVDAGYLASAIRPDFDAVDAIRKLKDPNAIPALELAALRLTGDKEKEMQELAQHFYAYQELIGGAGGTFGIGASPGGNWVLSSRLASPYRWRSILKATCMSRTSATTEFSASLWMAAPTASGVQKRELPASGSTLDGLSMSRERRLAMGPASL